MTDSNATGTDPTAALEASGDYRVLRKLPRRREFAAEDGAVKLGVILDIETTGLNAATDEIIELGMLKVSFSSDGRVFRIIDEFGAFRQPNVPIPADVTALTGCRNNLVGGAVGIPRRAPS